MDTMIDIWVHFFLVFKNRLPQIYYDDSELWGMSNIPSNGEDGEK